MFEILERLEHRGVVLSDIVDAAMVLYVPHGIEAAEAGSRLEETILAALTDPNVCSLLSAAILLEDDLVNNRDHSELGNDPVFLLADEIIGMAIAELIGGTYARFGFTRYDQQKPGILSRLGPFLDDAVAGLIAGCTSRLYSESG